MVVHFLGNAIGKRTLKTSTGQDITIYIGAPQYSEELGHICPYKIIGANGEEKIRIAGGVDDIHAIQMAFEKIGIDLYFIDKEISWEDFEKGDTGFPISEKIRNAIKD